MSTEHISITNPRVGFVNLQKINPFILQPDLPEDYRLSEVVTADVADCSLPQLYDTQPFSTNVHVEVNINFYFFGDNHLLYFSFSLRTILLLLPFYIAMCSVCLRSPGIDKGHPCSLLIVASLALREHWLGKPLARLLQ